MRSINIIVCAACAALLLVPHTLFADGGLMADRTEKTWQVDNLGDDFQRQGPWSRHTPEGSRDSDMSRQSDYSTVPDSRFPPDGSACAPGYHFVPEEGCCRQ